MTKLELAGLILRDKPDQSVYMLTFPTRGPGRYRQDWSREDGARQLAKSKSKEELVRWAELEGVI